MKKIDWAKTYSNIIVVLSGVLFYYFLTNYTTFASVVKNFFNAFSPFVWAFVLAYILNPVVNYFETQTQEFSRPRVIAIGMTVLIVSLVVGVIVSFLMPQLSDSIQMLFTNMPAYLTELGNLITRFAAFMHVDFDGTAFINNAISSLPVNMMDIVSNSITEALNVTVKLSGWFVNVLISVVASIYMLSGKDIFKRQLTKAVYAIAPKKHIDRIMELAHRTNYVFSRFMVGKIVDSVIIGALCLLFMAVMGLDYAMLISMFVAVTNVIPFFGPFIGAVPGVILLFIVDPVQAVTFIILIVALQQLDGNIIGPAILGDSLGLSALWILFAIMVSGSLFGFAGMLLGVPTFALIYSIASEIINERLEKRKAEESAFSTAAPNAEGEFEAAAQEEDA